MGKYITEELTDDTGGDLSGDVGSAFPVGTILAWMCGGFTGANNTGNLSTTLSDNTIADTNAYLVDFGFKVCDGTIISEGPLDTLYTPNLSDDRFLMGDNQIGTGTAASAIGGSNDYMAHTHDFTQPSGHSDHSVTDPGNHTFTQPSAHGITQPNYSTSNHNHQIAVKTPSVVTMYNIAGTGATATSHVQHDDGYDSSYTRYLTGNNTATLYTKSISIGSNRTSNLLVDGQAASVSHTGGSVSAHSGSDVDSHSAHSGGAVTTVVESRTGENRPKYISFFYIMRII